MSGAECVSGFWRRVDRDLAGVGVLAEETYLGRRLPDCLDLCRLSHPACLSVVFRTATSGAASSCEVFARDSSSPGVGVVDKPPGLTGFTTQLLERSPRCPEEQSPLARLKIVSNYTSQSGWGVWTAWASWTPCRECGRGERDRVCQPFGRPCAAAWPAQREFQCKTCGCPTSPATSVSAGSFSRYGTSGQLGSGAAPSWLPWASEGECAGCRGHLRRVRRCSALHQCSGLFDSHAACRDQPHCRQWTPWSPWEGCAVTCGRGTQLRTRACPGGECFGSSVESIPCDRRPCATPKAWTAWSPWSPCSASCGEGRKKRRRECEGEAYLCGGPAEEDAPCRGPACQAVAQAPLWSPWSPCSVTCGQGSQVRQLVGASSRFFRARWPSRRRFALKRGSQPRQGRSESRPCGGEACAWSTWGSWADCSVTCGQGKRERRRLCPDNLCEGRGTDESACRRPDCPVLLTWETWGRWMPCSASCGPGKRMRVRLCTKTWFDPPQSQMYDDCGGNRTESRDCKTAECPPPPPPPSWSSWESWSECSRSCGTGLEERRRACSLSFRCTGLRYEKRMCHLGQCQPVTKACAEPAWSAWSLWSECSASCGGGEKAIRSTCVAQPGCPADECLRGRRIATECNPFPCCEQRAPSWTEWSRWGLCSRSCGGGERVRRRNCPVERPAPGCPLLSCQGGTASGFDRETCSQQSCCLPPQISAWQLWQPCSVSCGGGTRRRSRRCIQQPNCPGACLEPLEEEGVCGSESCCPSAQRWAPWSPWTPCSRSCGAGERSRTRQCPVEAGCAASCPGEGEAVQLCSQGPCAAWLAWLPWAACSSSCAEGRRRRVRLCSLPDGCEGSDQEAQDCQAEPCPQWLKWQAWTPCTASCEGGTRLHIRECPILNSCEPGLPTDQEPCNDAPCRIPSWQPWAEWTACSRTCGGGLRQRLRACSEAARCQGSSTEEEACGAKACAAWSPWSPWSLCSSSCGGGLRSRSRLCAPSAGLCPGEDLETDECASAPCRPGPTWLQWEQWQPCSISCGGSGTRMRYRDCSQPGECLGEGSEEGGCSNGDCETGWIAWDAWSACSVSCGDVGLRSRSRGCGQPGSCPSEGAVEVGLCDEGGCPSWAQWEAWSPCSQSCGGGRSHRQRLCSPPGACEMDQAEIFRLCGVGECGRWRRPSWAAWGAWGSCSAACERPGRRFRFRDCATATGANNSACAVGRFWDEQRCVGEACNAVWLAWGGWSLCGVSCGAGIRRRSRQCTLDTVRFGKVWAFEEGGEWTWLARVLRVVPGTRVTVVRRKDQPPAAAAAPNPGPAQPAPTLRISGLENLPPMSFKVLAELVKSHLVAVTSAQPCAWDKARLNDPAHLERALRHSGTPMALGGASASGVATTVALHVSPPNCCGGEHSAFELCRGPACPLSWLGWGPWSACSVSCGSPATGFRSRARLCGALGGRACPREAMSEPCSPGPCPYWQAWAAWSVCSAKACGVGGTRSRLRFCNVAGRCQGERRQNNSCEGECGSKRRRSGPLPNTQWSTWNRVCREGLRDRSRVHKGSWQFDYKQC